MFRARAPLFTLIAYTGLAFAQQPTGQDWSTPYQTALLSKFTMTKLASDGVSVADAGTPVILRRDGIVLFRGVGKRLFGLGTNKYSNGTIDPARRGDLLAKEERDGVARIFGAGEALWLTDISFERKEDGVTLHLLSDLYNGVRYVGKLEFRFGNDAKPTPEQLLATVAEVFEPAAIPGKAGSSVSVATAGLPAGFEVLDRVRMDELQTTSPGAQLTLLALRGDPTIFDRDKTAWRKFIDMNNCSYAPSRNAAQERHRREAAKQSLEDEFQYPSILEAYKKQAPGILDLVSDKIIVRMDTYPEKMTGGDVDRPLALGQYDMQAKAFPFVKIDGTKISSIKLSYTALNAGNGSCANPFNLNFKIVFPAVELSEVRMDEQDARAYVADLTQRGFRSRPLFLTLEVEILPEAPRTVTPTRPQMSIEQSAMSEGTLTFDPRAVVTFSAKVTKITATAQTGQATSLGTPTRPLGVLYP